MVAAHQGGNEALPKRFVFIVKASGIDNYNLMPESVAKMKETVRNQVDSYKNLKPPTHKTMIDVSLMKHDLPKLLEPLKDFKEKINIVQGLSGNNLRGNHTSGYGTLSCYNSELMPIAPTVDALLGMKHSTGPLPPCLEWQPTGRCEARSRCRMIPMFIRTFRLYKSGQGVAFQASPTKAFNELFGSAVMSEGDLKKDSAVNRNLMEFLKDDAKAYSKTANHGNGPGTF